MRYKRFVITREESVGVMKSAAIEYWRPEASDDVIKGFCESFSEFIAAHAVLDLPHVGRSNAATVAGHVTAEVERLYLEHGEKNGRHAYWSRTRTDVFTKAVTKYLIEIITEKETEHGLHKAAKRRGARAKVESPAQHSR